MFNPTALDIAIKKVEVTIPDTPGGRVMLAVYRPFMLRLSKELDDAKGQEDIVEIFEGVGRMISNLMVTLCRSTADNSSPSHSIVLIATLMDLVRHSVSNDLHHSFTDTEHTLLQSHDGTIQ